MVCYQCGGETQVINSRPQKRTNQVWRRRACVLCDAVYTTTEGIDYSKNLLVRSPNQKHLQPLNRDRLMLSLYKSLGHRPTALTDAAGLAATVIAKVAPKAQDGIVESSSIIKTTLVALSRFDKLAAQHYQAFHRVQS